MFQVDLSKQNKGFQEIDFENNKDGIKEFTIDYLCQTKTEVAKSWIELFLLYCDRLDGKDLANAIINYELIKKKPVHKIFLKNLIARCENFKTNEDQKFWEHAVKFFNKQNIQRIDREIVLRWLRLFEGNLNNELLLDSYEAFFSNFELRPGDLKKNISFTCFDNQVYEFSVALLSKYEIFQKKLRSTAKLSLRLNNVVIAVVREFENFLYAKEHLKTAKTTFNNFPRDPQLKDPYLLVQLLDLSRWVKDEKLTEICLKKQVTPYLNEASYAAIDGDNALSRQISIVEAHNFYFNAINLRSTDFLSLAAFCNIAMEGSGKENQVLPQTYFEEALKDDPDNHVLYLYQAQILVGEVKKIKKKEKEIFADFLRMIKMMRLGEDVNLNLLKCVSTLQIFLENTDEQIEINNDRIFQDQFSVELKEIFEIERDKLLDQAEKLLENISLPFDQLEQQDSTLELEWLKFELKILKRRRNSISKQQLNKWQDSIKKLSPTNEHQVQFKFQYLVAQHYLAQNNSREAKNALQNALFVPHINYTHYNHKTNQEEVAFQMELISNLLKNDNIQDAAFIQLSLFNRNIMNENRINEINRELMLLDKDLALIYGSNLIKMDGEDKDTEACQAYAEALFDSEQYAEAEKYFLHSDLYNPLVNYYLGIIKNKNGLKEERDKFFERALKLSFVEDADFAYCKSITEQLCLDGGPTILVNILQFFLKTTFLEKYKSDVCLILDLLASKTSDKELQGQVVEHVKNLREKIKPLKKSDGLTETLTQLKSSGSNENILVEVNLSIDLENSTKSNNSDET